MVSTAGVALGWEAEGPEAASGVGHGAQGPAVVLNFSVPIDTPQGRT